MTPRVALKKVEAAEAIGLSVDSFERYVMPDLRVVRVGSGAHPRILIPLRELERWVERNAAQPLAAELERLR
jgi:hypothetical protein